MDERGPVPLADDDPDDGPSSQEDLDALLEEIKSPTEKKDRDADDAAPDAFGEKTATDEKNTDTSIDTAAENVNMPSAKTDAPKRTAESAPVAKKEKPKTEKTKTVKKPDRGTGSNIGGRDLWKSLTSRTAQYIYLIVSIVVLISVVTAVLTYYK